MVQWGLFSVSPEELGRLVKAKQQGYCSNTISLHVPTLLRFFSSCGEGLPNTRENGCFLHISQIHFLKFLVVLPPAGLLSWWLHSLWNSEDFNPTLSGIIVISMVNPCSVNSLLTLTLNYFCPGLLFAEKPLDTWDCGQHKLSSLSRQVNLYNMEYNLSPCLQLQDN